MRKLIGIFCLIFAVTLTASAQAVPNPSWSRVQALPVGTNIHVKAKKSTVCALQSATADTLTCLHKESQKVDTFQLAEIKWVKIPHVGRSAAAGAAPGVVIAGVAGIVEATEHCGLNTWFCGLLPAIIGALGLAGAIIGGIVGALTDFTAPTIYRRP